MKPATIVGAVLIVLGAAALVYKGFSYTSEETVLQVGSVKATAQTEKDVAIPSWAGIAAIVVGVLIIGVGRRRKAKKGPTHRVGPVRGTQCRVNKARGEHGIGFRVLALQSADRGSFVHGLAQGRDLSDQSNPGGLTAS